ncbi:MAG: cbb3-type cytochrome oxidase assembly protein CcoS [Kangiella sp.]|nr:MAG: cbb3-type cytochrome oxidase assembly protein CcoS [Kangiella sp.]
MASIYWLIPLTLVILSLAVYTFFWAVKDGQYDDLDAEASKILFDDDEHL